MDLSAVVTIRRPPEEIYGYWRRLEHLPAFMAHLESVRVTGDETSHWVATAPFDRTVEWDATITEDVPGERISWTSTGDADVENRGSVRFAAAPGDQGTEVHVTLSYEAPGGALGKAIARYFGEDPRQHLDDDLRRLKQVLETGEVVRSDGAPSGKQSRDEFPQRAAQPLPPDELARIRREIDAA
jgi:uncharacterized membrane protein